MTAALIAFVRAQLDKDAEVARACAGDGKWAAEDIAIYGPELSVDVRTHMARQDPARALRGIEAKRQVIRLYEDADLALMAASGTVLAGGMKVRRRAYGDVLKQLAAEYADHPDFDPSWSV